jgi:autotransporter passenger strand-loop-strand repeat protein/probable HAF family extracellular repeat protein
MGTTVNNGSTYDLTSGGTDNGDIVSAGGTMLVEAGAVASGTVVNAGFQAVSGGYAFTTVDDASGPNTTQLNGINSAGEAVGTYYDGSNNGHAFTYQNGSYTELGTFGYSDVATAINNNGEVIGYFRGASDNYNTHFAEGFSYSSGIFTEINPQPNG